MDDKFLYQLRQNPDTVFVKNLQKKLSSYQSTVQGRGIMSLRPFVGDKKANRIWMAAFLLILLLVSITVTPVRALILAVPIEIAGRIFETTDDYPGDDRDDIEIIEPQIMSLDEALTLFPYAVKLPGYIPPEYVLNAENVRVYLYENWPHTIDMTWYGEGAGMVLTICGNCVWDRGEIIAPDAVEEVSLENQQPAILVRGGWYQNEKVWDYDIALTLEWQVDNNLYRLSSGTLTVEQLIAIANSTIEN